MNEYRNMIAKAEQYRAVMSNTEQYRLDWQNYLKKTIEDQLRTLGEACKLDFVIEKNEKVQNAESVIFSLGKHASGIAEKVDDDTLRHLIRHNGMLVYQQLFNGKVQVMMIQPYIEGFGEPRPPKVFAIYRPEELKPPFIQRNMEDFLRILIEWEDFDDDEPAQKIGFNLPYKMDKTPKT